MREMIVAPDETGRRRALAKLLPMQREDFEGIFEAMAGQPVTIRLLDPPLHEFLPHGKDELGTLARVMKLPAVRLERLPASPVGGQTRSSVRLGRRVATLTQISTNIGRAIVFTAGRGGGCGRRR